MTGGVDEKDGGVRLGARGDRQWRPAVRGTPGADPPAVPPGPVDDGGHLVRAGRGAGPQSVGGDLSCPVAVGRAVEVDALGEVRQLRAATAGSAAIRTGTAASAAAESRKPRRVQDGSCAAPEAKLLIELSVTRSR